MHAIFCSVIRLMPFIVLLLYFIQQYLFYSVFIFRDTDFYRTFAVCSNLQNFFYDFFPKDRNTFNFTATPLQFIQNEEQIQLVFLDGHLLSGLH